MRKILIISVTLFSLTFNSFAGDGDRFVNVSGGLMYRKTATALASMEFEGKYHNAWEIYVDMTTAYKKCEIDNTIFCKKTFWDYKTVSFGGAYKPAFYRWKNANLRARVGADIGIDEGYSFSASVDLGLEYSYSFKNRMQLVITQKNDFAFWTRDNFKNGLLIGLKIPLN
jgi:hypothetical protein